nr:aldo/keto reductase [Kineosporia mesophila]
MSEAPGTQVFGVTEEILAEALHPYPEHLLISTKIGQVQTRPREWVALGRPEFLRHQCEASLRRLKVERIDLLSLHRVDPTVPLEDQVGELKMLQDEGKIGAIGLSEVDVDQIEQARAIVEIASVQNIYNLTVRNWDPVLDHCTRERIAFTAWYPILSGNLAGAEGLVRDIAAAHGAPDRAGLVAGPLGRDGADSRNGIDRSSGGERRGRADHAEPAGVHRASRIARVRGRPVVALVQQRIGPGTGLALPETLHLFTGQRALVRIEDGSVGLDPPPPD